MEAENQRMDEIMEELKKVFTPDKFTIKRNNETYYIATINPSGPCLKLRFRRDNVEIDKLDKCGIQGFQSIKMVEEAVKNITNIKEIILYDGSTISVCGQIINLPCLKILSKGESWYNSLGYYSESKEWERETNAEIIAKSFQQFLDDSLKEYNKYNRFKIDEEFTKLKTDIETNSSTWFPGTNLTDTTKGYFTKINSIILSDKDDLHCSEEKKTKYEWLSKFFNKIFGNQRMLKYIGKLSKNNEKLKLTAGKKLKKYRKKTRKYIKKTNKRRKITHRNISHSKQ